MVTVLFVDLVASSGPDPHDIVRSAVKKSAGRNVRSEGDGCLATFGSPRKAVECAMALIDAARALDVDARVGVHSERVEHAPHDAVAIAEGVATRIGGRARRDEVLVSDTVRDLMAGTGLVFTPRGMQAINGTPGRHRLFAVGERPPPLRAAAPHTPIRLVVADDHPLWRETLKGLLEHDGFAEVVAEAATGDEAVAMVVQVDADVIVLDVDMPHTSGIDAVQAVTAARPGTKVLMLSSSKERDEVLASVRGGASGYLLKTARREEVVDAVRRLHHGELVFPPEISPMVLAELRKADASPADRTVTGIGALTARERDVLRLVASGASNQGVAKQLHLSAKTVEAHIAAIFMKLGLEASADEHRRVQAAVKFLTESPQLVEG